jgi:hypothetical protein
LKRPFKTTKYPGKSLCEKYEYKLLILLKNRMNWAKIERDNKIIVFILFKEKNGNAH